MQHENKHANNLELKGQTPTTLAIAILFIILVCYFITDHYFTASEYYAEAPPYLAIIVLSSLGIICAIVALKKFEPERKDSLSFAVLMGLGVGLSSYSLIPRLNIITDSNGLQSYPYTLSEDYIWQASDSSLPKLHLYFKGSDWWQQYKPGDSYTFELRKGGLNIWQVNMTKIYEEQQRYYDCNGIISCIQK